MERWVVSAKKEDFIEWGRLLGIDPVVARILRNRDIMSVEEARRFLFGGTEAFHNPFLLPDMERAVDAILEAVSAGKRLRVIGDYDVDGVTSSYILSKGLELLGANVDVRIPHRIRDGYGLNEELIRQAKADDIQMIVTCDNGIAAMKQVELACELGLSVVVTDHHEVPFELLPSGEKKQLLPPALAVVDPKRMDSSYPFPEICGAFVAYKLIVALTETILGRQESGDTSGKAEYQTLLNELLVFAALGTVCDVMPLLDENRILVKEGLKLLPQSPNCGLRALLEVNGLDPACVNSYHFGFVIGPCVNAAGRLESADLGFDLFRENSFSAAVRGATDLKALNDSRKNMTTRGEQDAIAYVQEHGLEQDPVMVIYLAELHESLAGIIAGKIRERYNHPAIVLTKGGEGVKGSGRSIPAYHMFEHLSEVSGLLDRFGGHAMAAGLSLPEENIPLLQRELNLRSGLKEEDFYPVVRIDVPMPLYYGNMELARQLQELEPTGTANDRPLFAEKDVVLTGITRFGKNKEYLRFTVSASGNFRGQVIYFGNAEKFLQFLEERHGAEAQQELLHGRGSYPISMTYQLSINSYMGRDSLQYIMQNYC